MEKKEENITKDNERLQSTAAVHSDEIIEAVDRMSLKDLKEADAGIKLLIAQYKEKCAETRSCQTEIKGLSIKISELSNRLAVARERLTQIGNFGFVLNIFSLIAGAMITFSSLLPDGNIKKILFALGIAMFVVCAVYYFLNRNQQKGISERE